MNGHDDSGVFGVKHAEWKPIPADHQRWLEVDIIMERLEGVLDDASLNVAFNGLRLLYSADADGYVALSEQLCRFADGTSSESTPEDPMDPGVHVRALISTGSWIREGNRLRYAPEVFRVLPKSVDPNDTPEVEA